MNKKLLSLSAILTLLVVLSGCSKNREAEVSDILSTIPSDVTAVVVADVSALGSELTDRGVDATVGAMFVEGYNHYVTGFVSDSEKFKEVASKQSGAEFASEGDIEVSGRYALRGNRFWVLEGEGLIQPKDIKHFCELSEKQSFMANSYAATLTDLKHDVEGWADITAMLNLTKMDFGRKAMLDMIVNGVLKDPAFIVFDATIKEKTVESTMRILDSKGDVAKMLLPTGKIDPKVINNISGKANSLAAIAVDKKTIEKIQEMLKGEKGLSQILTGIISCIDGTCALAKDGKENESGVISTNGINVNGLAGALSMSDYKANMSGNYLLFGKGTLAGTTPIADLAQGFEGAFFAMTMTGETVPSPEMKRVLVTLNPAKGGAEIKATVELNETVESLVNKKIK